MTKKSVHLFPSKDALVGLQRFEQLFGDGLALDFVLVVQFHFAAVFVLHKRRPDSTYSKFIRQTNITHREVLECDNQLRND